MTQLLGRIPRLATQRQPYRRWPYRRWPCHPGGLSMVESHSRSRDAWEARLSIKTIDSSHCGNNLCASERERLLSLSGMGRGNPILERSCAWDGPIQFAGLRACTCKHNLVCTPVLAGSQH
eukprot:365942-Chlamydomonas_euryale.AAC.9